MATGPRSRSLSPPRRAAHRRRGHDRVRAGPAAGSASITGASRPTSCRRPRARPRVLAVRVRGRIGRLPRGDDRPEWRGLRARVHVLPFAGRRGGRARGPSHPRDEDLVAASATKGERLRSLVSDALGDHAAVGDIRGRGLFLGSSWSPIARAAIRSRAPRASPSGSSRPPVSAVSSSTRGPGSRTALTATRS
jgi:hypothetical protein